MQEATYCARIHCILRAGLETLTAMERVPTDADDRPKTDIRITDATIFVNPYKDEEEEERKVAEAERLKVCQPALSLLGDGGAPSGSTPAAVQYALHSVITTCPLLCFKPGRRKQ